MKLAAKLEPKPIPHLVWDGSWQIKRSRKAPMIQVRYRLNEAGYKASGYKMPVRHSSQANKDQVTATCSALADTGCTTMVAGMTFVRNLGLKESDLLPVRTEIKAANKTEIKIIGAVIVEIELHKAGHQKQAKQVVYVIGG